MIVFPLLYLTSATCTLHMTLTWHWHDFVHDFFFMCNIIFESNSTVFVFKIITEENFLTFFLMFHKTENITKISISVTQLANTMPNMFVIFLFLRKLKSIVLIRNRSNYRRHENTLKIFCFQDHLFQDLLKMHRGRGGTCAAIAVG